MTKVVDIRTSLESLIETALPTYEKLSDAYDSPDNVNLWLAKGFSIGYGPSENTSDNFCQGFLKQRRLFQFVLANIYMPNADADYRQTLEDNLMDDQFAVLAAIESDVTLTGTAISTAFQSDNGIEYLVGEDGDQKQFIIIVSTIAIDYEEGTT